MHILHIIQLVKHQTPVYLHNFPTYIALHGQNYWWLGACQEPNPYYYREVNHFPTYGSDLKLSSLYFWPENIKAVQMNFFFNNW